MAYLSVTYLSLDFSLGQESAKELAQYLLQITQSYSSILYKQSARVEIDRYSGSWKTVITISGSISLVSSHYCQFRSTIDWLIKDAKSVKEYLHETLVKEGLDAQQILEIKRRECTPDRIRRVFQRIERHRNQFT
jgi:tRNA A37 N6-isopentenylltransferase MiaA